MTTVQFASDLHLDVNNIQNFDKILKRPDVPDNNILILAGDIAEVRGKIWIKFMGWCSSWWSHVIVVPGNHEYYGSNFKAIRSKMSTVSQFQNVHVLDNSIVDIPMTGGRKMRVIGTTLWSYIPPQHLISVQNKMNDYNMISLDNGNMLRTTDTNNTYFDNLEWLRNELNIDRPDKTIVVSHHAPHVEYTSDIKYTKDVERSLNYAFASNTLIDLKTETMNKPIDLWIHGHTHFCHSTMILGTLVVSNQYGYKREQIPYKTDCSVEFQ